MLMKVFSSHGRLKRQTLSLFQTKAWSLSTFKSLDSALRRLIEEGWLNESKNLDGQDFGYEVVQQRQSSVVSFIYQALADRHIESLIDTLVRDA